MQRQIARQLCCMGAIMTRLSEQTVIMDKSSANAEADRTWHDSMERNESFTIGGRLKSVRFAVRGIGMMLKSQHNAWLHAFASFCILVTGGLLRISAGEWCWVVLAIMAVWTAEALNTALEFLADAASPEFHPLIKQAKDVAAGGVLISAMGSICIGLLVLGPHLLEFLLGLL
jgi:diacylglycerol kinase